MLSPRRRSEAREAFAVFDDRGVGLLDLVQLEAAVTAVTGSPVTQFELRELLYRSGVLQRDTAAPGVAPIDDDAFQHVQVDLEGLQRVLARKLAFARVEDELRRAFLALDIRSRGSISLEDLEHAVSRYAPLLAPGIARDAYLDLVGNADADVTFPQFVQLFQHKWHAVDPADGQEDLPRPVTSMH